MHFVDLMIIAAYMVLSIGLGIALRGKQEDLDDYFEGGGQMSGPFMRLVVGLSLAATLFSGISFVSIPSMAYQFGPAYAVTILTAPVFALVVGKWFLPLYLRANPTSPYEFLEVRLGSKVRTMASILFLALRLGWMAALIYAPTLIILSICKLDDSWLWPVLLAVGLSATVYTVMGGIRGVIFTDAMQFVVIAGGILGAIAFLWLKLPEPWKLVTAIWSSEGRSVMPSWSLDPSLPITVWTVGVGATISGFGSYIADQMSLQRYLAIGNVRAAQKAFYFNIISAYTVVPCLVVTGLLVSAWYSFYGGAGLPGNPDKIFPHFVATVMPVGLAGLIMAAVLAATMSSMTSGVNALAGCIVNDLASAHFKSLSNRSALSKAKLVSLGIGLLATLASGVVEKLGTIFDMAQIILGTFLGPILAAMLLAAFKVRVNENGVIAGMIAGVVVGLLLTFSSFASLWVSPVILLVTVVVALVWTRFCGPSSILVQDGCSTSRFSKTEPSESRID